MARGGSRSFSLLLRAEKERGRARPKSRLLRRGGGGFFPGRGWRFNWRGTHSLLSRTRANGRRRDQERERERKVEGTLAREKEQAERRGVLFERSREGGGSNVDAADARVEEGVCDKKKFRFSIFSSFLLFVPVRDVFSLSKLQRRDGKLSSRVGGAACRRALCGGRRVWFNTIGNRALESERERPDLKKKNRFISFSSFFA